MMQLLCCSRGCGHQDRALPAWACAAVDRLLLPPLPCSRSRSRSQGQGQGAQEVQGRLSTQPLEATASGSNPVPPPSAGLLPCHTNASASWHVSSFTGQLGPPETLDTHSWLMLPTAHHLPPLYPAPVAHPPLPLFHFPVLPASAPLCACSPVPYRGASCSLRNNQPLVINSCHGCCCFFARTNE